jgi:hypothetical protein
MPGSVDPFRLIPTPLAHSRQAVSRISPGIRILESRRCLSSFASTAQPLQEVSNAGQFKNYIDL